MAIREGLFFILFGICLLGAGAWANVYCAIPGFLLTLFFVNFFRDPNRHPPAEDGIVSPADGKVIAIQEIDPEKNEGYSLFISIFMNVFDVHVNRSPIAGRISEYKHFRGKFLPAYEERAPFENERNEITIVNVSGKIKLSQVAGLIARRIVFKRKVGDILKRGERFGMIRFGSRVDLWLPRNYETTVNAGEKVYAGHTLLAKMKV